MRSFRAAVIRTVMGGRGALWANLSVMRGDQNFQNVLLIPRKGKRGAMEKSSLGFSWTHRLPSWHICDTKRQHLSYPRSLEDEGSPIGAGAVYGSVFGKFALGKFCPWTHHRFSLWTPMEWTFLPCIALDAFIILVCCQCEYLLEISDTMEWRHREDIIGEEFWAPNVEKKPVVTSLGTCMWGWL